LKNDVLVVGYVHVRIAYFTMFVRPTYFFRPWECGQKTTHRPWQIKMQQQDQ
jgi:hypothetical protein